MLASACRTASEEPSVLYKNDSIETKSAGAANGALRDVVRISHKGETVLALVRRARRRLFYNELFAQGANASSAALAAFILLLLLGTEILQLASGAPHSRCGRRRRACIIARRRLADRRTPSRRSSTAGCRLADTLSTALFFSDPERAVARVCPKSCASSAESRRTARPVGGCSPGGSVQHAAHRIRDGGAVCSSPAACSRCATASAGGSI